MEDAPLLKCDNIVVSSRGITETDGKKVMLFVPSTEIDQIAVKFDRSDHRPIFSMSVGVVLSAVGVYGLVYFFLSPAGFRYESAMIIFGFVGGSMIFDTLKKRYFLEVHQRKGICRLVFSKNAQWQDVQAFCKQIEATYKYQVRDAVSFEDAVLIRR